MLRCLLLLVIAVALSGAERLLLDDQGSSLVVRLDPPPLPGTACIWSAQPTTLTVLPTADQARVLLTGPGTVRVTAQVQVPGAPARTVTATWRITARPDRVVLVPATLRLTAGVPATITALVRDQFGSPWAQEVAWSWRCAGATVTGPGATAEVLLGAAADLGDRDVVAEARVPAATGAPVILSGRAPAVVNQPPSLVTATVEPIDARTVDLHLTLADDGPLAAVLVTPTTTGTAIAALDDRTDSTRSPEERRWRVALADTGTVPIALTLTDVDGAVATATVAVTTVPVPTRLEVDPPAARLSPGASWRPQARVLDQVGQPVALPVIWEVPETPSVTWQAVEGRLEVAPVLAEHTPARLRLTARVPGTGLTAEVTVDLNHPPRLTADLERDYGIPGASRVRVMLAASDDQPGMTVRWYLPGRTAADEARWLFHQNGMEAQVDLDEAPTLEVQAVVVDADGATTATSTLRLERGVGVLIAGEILDLQALHLRDQVHQPISTTPLVWTLDGPGNLQGAVYTAPTNVSYDQTAVVTAQVPNGPILSRLHLALRTATLVPHLASGTLLTPGTRVTAELRDGQGALLPGPRLYWTSDPADLLTEDGMILDRSPGAYRITVHAGSLQTSVNVLLDGPPQVEPTATISGPRDLLLTAAITAPAQPVTVQWQTQGAAGLVLDDPRSATTTARATAPGPWSATVTVTSASGRSTTATLQGVVAAVPTTLAVAAPEPLLVQQPAVVTVDLEDQFGTPMVLPSNPTWEVSGPAQFASEPPILTAQAPGLVNLRLQTAGLTATWSGTALHQAPRFGALPPLSAPWGEPLDLIVTAETPSGGPAPTYQITGLPPGITVDPATGRLHGQAADPGTWPLGLAATTPSGTATAQATLVILPRPADLTWNPPSTLVADQPLGPTHLNAEAQTPGTITYDPPAGTRLAPGIRTLTALLVPTDTQRYAARQVTIPIEVVAAVPVLTWAPPAPIVAGTPLTTLQLSATANVPGQFVYTPPPGTVLPAGTSILKVTFLPEDQSSATTVLLQVPLTVLPADGNGGGGDGPDPVPDPLAGITLVITPDAALAGNQQERDGEMVFVTNQASISLTVGTNVALPEGWNVKEVTITGGESPAKATAFGALTVPLQEGANTLITTVLFEGPSPQARAAPRRPHGARGRAVCGVSTRLFSLPLTFAAPRAPRPVREAPGNPPNPPPNASRSGDPLPIYRDSTPPTAVLTIPADYPDAPAQALLAPGALAILNQASASDCTTQRSQGLLSFPRNGFAVTVQASEPLSLQSPPTAKVVYEDGTTVSLTVEVTSPNDLRPELRITGFSNLPDSVTYDSQTLEPSESHGRGTVKLTLKDRATTNGGNTATDLPVVQVWSMCTQPPMRLGVQQFQSPVVVPTGSNLAVKDALGESPILSTILTPPTVVGVGKLSQILPGHPGLPSWSLSVPPEASASPKSTFIGWGLEDRFLHGLEVNTPTALSPEVLDVYGNRWKTLFFLQKSLFRKEIASLPALNPGLHSYKHRWMFMETTIAPLQDPTIHQSNVYNHQYEITVMEQWILALRSPLVLPYQLIGEGWLGLTEGYGSDAQDLQLVPVQGSLNELTTLELEISQAYPSHKLDPIFYKRNVRASVTPWYPRSGKTLFYPSFIGYNDNAYKMKMIFETTYQNYLSGQSTLEFGEYDGSMGEESEAYGLMRDESRVGLLPSSFESMIPSGGFTDIVAGNYLASSSLVTGHEAVDLKLVMRTSGGTSGHCLRSVQSEAGESEQYAVNVIPSGYQVSQVKLRPGFNRILGKAKLLERTIEFQGEESSEDLTMHIETGVEAYDLDIEEWIYSGTLERTGFYTPRATVVRPEYDFDIVTGFRAACLTAVQKSTALAGTTGALRIRGPIKKTDLLAILDAQGTNLLGTGDNKIQLTGLDNHPWLPNAEYAPTNDLLLKIGKNVKPGTYDVVLGGTYDNADDLVKALGGYRIKDALVIGKAQGLEKAQGVEEEVVKHDRLLPISDPHPVITLDPVQISLSQVSNGIARFLLTGTVTDAVADMDENARPKRVLCLGHEAAIVDDAPPAADPVWKPHAWRGKFSLPLEIPLTADDNLVRVTVENALGNQGSAGLVLSAKVHLEGPDPGASTRSREVEVMPWVAVGHLLSREIPNTVTVHLGGGQSSLVLVESKAGSGDLSATLEDGTILTLSLSGLVAPSAGLGTLPENLSGILIVWPLEVDPWLINLDVTWSEDVGMYVTRSVEPPEVADPEAAYVPVLDAITCRMEPSSGAGLIQSIRLRREFPEVLPVPVEAFSFAGVPFHWVASPDDARVWISDKAVMLVQLPGATAPQVIRTGVPDHPADLAVRNARGQAEETYQALIIRDSPHDTISVGRGLTVRITAAVEGWTPSEAGQSLTQGQWTLENDSSAYAMNLVEPQEVESQRHDSQEWIIVGRTLRTTEFAFKLTVPPGATLGLWKMVWTDPDGHRHELRDQVRIVNPSIIMICLDGVNGDLFKEAIAEAGAGSGLNLIFGKAERPPGAEPTGLPTMPNPQWFSPSPTGTAINSLPSITWTNWATIFTGKEPGEHGILGNSFFRREVEGSRPVFSANAEVAGDGKDHKLAATCGLSPLLRPTVDTLYQDFNGISASTPIEQRGPVVSVHTWYPEKKGTEFFDQADYGKSRISLGHQISERYLWLSNAGGLASMQKFLGIENYLDALEHNEEGARAADAISGARALNYLTDPARIPAIMGIYFPGPDNIGHAQGRSSPGNDPSKSLSVTKDHLMSHDGTDGQLQRLHKRVREMGAQNAVIWLAVSDHGLMGTNRDQHAFPESRKRSFNPLVTFPESGDGNNGLTGGLFSLRDSRRGMDYSNIRSPRPVDDFYSEMEVFFRRVFDDAATVRNQDQTTNSVWYGRKITWNGETKEGVDALWAKEFPVRGIYSPDGGLAHIYVRGAGNDENNDVAWNSGSPADLPQRVRELAWYIARESLGDFTGFPGNAPLMPKNVGNPSEGSQFKDALKCTINGETVAAVFVWNEGRYQRFVPLNSPQLSETRDITVNENGGSAWIDAVNRLNGMAVGQTIKRSGDIVLLFNTQEFFATVNDDKEEELNGWHGGPTKAESVTPIIYASPGYGWYSGANGSIKSNSTIPGLNTYRNSTIRESLKSLMRHVQGGVP